MAEMETMSGMHMVLPPNWTEEQLDEYLVDHPDHFRHRGLFTSYIRRYTIQIEAVERGRGSEWNTS